MTVQIAFLRSVNLGKPNKINMFYLRKTMEESGYQNVRTYLQSGNIMLESRESHEKLSEGLNNTCNI